MRVSLALALSILLLAACSSGRYAPGDADLPDGRTGADPDAPKRTSVTRERFRRSLSARLSKAELALTRFKLTLAAKMLDKLEKATEEWEELSDAESLSLGLHRERLAKTRFIAMIFAKECDPVELAEIYASDPKGILDRFLEDGSTTRSLACYRLFALSGLFREADLGFDRMLEVLKGEGKELERFRVRVTRATTLVGIGIDDEGRAERERAGALIESIAEAKLADLREYRSYILLPALASGRRGNFGDAIAYLEILEKRVPVHPVAKSIERYLGIYRDLEKSWPAELERYADEADDLPRVEFMTDQGSFEITLFEDDAPTSVANFITLVEDGFYDGTIFHRLVPHFVAQGGDPDGTGEGGPGYAIAREVTRNHFRGTLGMARSAHPDSAGSQFYFALDSATTHGLNEGYAVFGRVSKGMKIVDRLRLGSKLLRARVLNRRNHSYRFKKLPEQE